METSTFVGIFSKEAVIALTRSTKFIVQSDIHPEKEYYIPFFFVPELTIR
jgi:hypothetical protein